MRLLDSLKRELSTISGQPNRFEPEIMKQALQLSAQIFVAEHPEMGNGKLVR